MNKGQQQWRGPANQGGVIAVLVLVSLVAMLGIVGMALDGGHGMLNKSRLQNVVDAAALSSAKALDTSSGDELIARTEALAMFADNAGESGNAEIAGALGAGLSVAVEFSTTLDPFVPGTIPAQYVRVTATGLNLPGWFIPIMGVAEKRVAASAVAGPSPTLVEVCNVVPMMACGDPTATDGFWGYSPGEVEVLKTSANGADSEVGPGNFQLVRLDGAQGGADIRDGLGGNYDACLNTESETIQTEPGNTIGPVAQGLNTRLGLYQGPVSADDFPSDLVQDQISPLTYVDGVIHFDGEPISDANLLPWDYQHYLSDLMLEGSWNFYEPDGVALRRVLRLPVGNCDGTTNGAGEVPLLGILCFFLLQEVTQQGNAAEVFGQFMGADDTCSVSGKPGPDPVTGPGPYRIQLYKDPDWGSA
jgi:hypothetical protein